MAVKDYPMHTVVGDIEVSGTGDGCLLLTAYVNVTLCYTSEVVDVVLSGAINYYNVRGRALIVV